MVSAAPVTPHQPVPGVAQQQEQLVRCSKSRVLSLSGGDPDPIPQSIRASSCPLQAPYSHAAAATFTVRLLRRGTSE